MRRFREQEETRQERGLFRGHAPFQLTPLNSPIELAQVKCAFGSGLYSGARNINQRVGKSWGPDEVNWPIRYTGRRATTFLSSSPGGRLEAHKFGEKQRSPGLG